MFRKPLLHRVTQHHPARAPGMTGVVSSRETRAEASAWLARLHAGDRDAADEVAFRIWLDACPLHAAAFEAVDRVWSDVGGLTNLRPGAAQRHE